jgi:hypothetical protein
MGLHVPLRSHGETPLIGLGHGIASRRDGVYFDETRRQSLVSDRRAWKDQI